MQIRISRTVFVVIAALASSTGAQASSLTYILNTQFDAQTTSPQAQAVGNTVSIICPTGTLGRDLQDQCNALAGYALSQPSAPNTTTNTVLQQWSGEQATAEGTTSIDISNAQLKSIGGRLAALRMGARGITIGGISYDLQGHQLALAPGGALGGGASADDAGFGRWGGFINGGYQFGDRNTTALENGFSYDNKNVTAGVDYRLTDQSVLGAAFGYTSTGADLTGSAGKLDADSYDLTLYGSYYPTDSIYIDGTLTHGWNSFKQQRNISYTAPIVTNQVFTSKPNGDYWSGSLAAGLQMHHGALSYGPYARFALTRSSVDGFSETASNPGGAGSGLGLTVGKQNFRSTTLAFGGQSSYAVSNSWGVLLPYASVEYVHEFSNKNTTINASFISDPSATVFSLATDSGDRNYFKLGVGASAQFGNGRSAFVGYQALLGYKNLSSNAITGGVRLEF